MNVWLVKTAVYGSEVGAYWSLEAALAGIKALHPGLTWDDPEETSDPGYLPVEKWKLVSTNSEVSFGISKWGVLGGSVTSDTISKGPFEWTGTPEQIANEPLPPTLRATVDIMCQCGKLMTRAVGYWQCVDCGISVGRGE